MRVDVHAHYYPDRYVSCLDRFGRDTSHTVKAPGAGMTVDQRIELLDRSGIRVQVLCVGAQQPYFAKAADAITAAKLANDLYVEVREKHAGRFEAFATVPLPHVDASLAEMKRALDELGMVGVNLGCSVAGRPLDDGAFEPLFAELNRRGAVVFLHPQGVGCGPLLDDYGLNFTLGAPFEDAIAALRLVLAGVISRYPQIRVIVPHLGGPLPFLRMRLDGSLRGRTEYKPSEVLKQLWYDTVNENIPSLHCAREAFGADRLLFGTDFPHVFGDRFDRCLSYIQQSELPEEEKTAILDHNAQSLLGLADR
jgi:predicted TIM-barrel fold metal-dependent hydrolase